jgi:hypothetical protein
MGSSPEKDVLQGPSSCIFPNHLPHSINNQLLNVNRMVGEPNSMWIAVNIEKFEAAVWINMDTGVEHTRGSGLRPQTAQKGEYFHDTL